MEYETERSVAMPRPKPKYQIILTPEQVKELTAISQNYTAPYCEVQRAQLLLLAQAGHSNAEIARRLNCTAQTVRNWRRRWPARQALRDAPRRGAPRRILPTERAAVTALACTPPREHGEAGVRWNGDQLARVAVREGLVKRISGSSVRRFLRAEKIQPWQYHSWQKSTDPEFVAKAGPILDAYETAEVDAAQGTLTVCADEKTSVQARQRITLTQPAQSGLPVRISDRYKRMGAVHLFCALAVASGLTFTRTFASKCFAQFKEFLQGLFASSLCQGIKVLNLILDNGSTHAPKQLGPWIASLELSFEVRLLWLPKHASWLDQVEIIFSKVQRQLLTPNDFPSTQALERELAAYFAALNENPKPIHWTYTKTKMLAKFAPPEPST
jgi:transposase